MRLHWTILIAAILTHPSADLDAAPAVVTIPPARFAPTRAALHEWCGPGPFEACTRFVAYRLEATCVPSADGARVEATARVTALMFLRDATKLPHEHEHVRDVRTAIDDYVDTLSARQFPATDDCQAFVLQERSIFGDRVRGFAHDSAVRMGERR